MKLEVQVTEEMLDNLGKQVEMENLATKENKDLKVQQAQMANQVRMASLELVVKLDSLGNLVQVGQQANLDRGENQDFRVWQEHLA